MDLSIGCKELINNKWVYTTFDQVNYTYAEWVSLVKKQIKTQKDRASFAEIRQEAEQLVWCKYDTAEEVAYMIYAQRHCTRV